VGSFMLGSLTIDRWKRCVGSAIASPCSLFVAGGEGSRRSAKIKSPCLIAVLTVTWTQYTRVGRRIKCTRSTITRLPLLNWARTKVSIHIPAALF